MLAIQEVRSITFIYEKFIKKYFEGCLNSFYYFLADEGLDLSKMASCTVQKALSIIQPAMKDKATIYLIIDDTLQPKFGDHFDCYGTLFDHAKHEGDRFIKGHCFVSLAMSVPVITNHHIKYITLPTSCRLYDKSKIKLKMANLKCLTNLVGKAVYATFTTTNTEAIFALRKYLDSEDIAS